MQFQPPFLTRELIEYGFTSGRLPFFESVYDFALPWRSSEYLRNSPISYVDNVQTPLLQLHGDFDGVPIQQAEEFFTALQRLGKRARFVKYLGEGHVFDSPANIRDMWAQIFSWCDEYCDIKRDEKGNLIWKDNYVASRNGIPALKPSDFLKFSLFFDQNYAKP